MLIRHTFQTYLLETFYTLQSKGNVVPVQAIVAYRCVEG